MEQYGRPPQALAGFLVLLYFVVFVCWLLCVGTAGRIMLITIVVWKSRERIIPFVITLRKHLQYCVPLNGWVAFGLEICYTYCKSWNRGPQSVFIGTVASESCRLVLIHQYYSELAATCCLMGSARMFHKKPSWTLGVADRTAPSHKYNHAVRIWEVDAVGRQKIVISSGIGLAAVLAVGHLSWSVKLCLSLYGKLWTVHC